MRKNNTILTLDLRNNPGDVENIHSRLAMKKPKKIHILPTISRRHFFQKIILKDFLEISFFDVDIPQEIEEFYNQNLSEEEENEKEAENLEENNYTQEKEDLLNNKEEKAKKILKISE